MQLTLPTFSLKSSDHLADAQAGNLFLLALAAYFILQIIVRITLTDSLAMDEAEQAFAFQHLRLGYGTQPPLYTWLQWIAFSVFGFNVFALAVVKNIILFAIYACMFYLARPLVGCGAAIAASASLLLFPEIAWESQRDLTHTVLLTALSCATLWCYFALLRRPIAKRYALFGLLIGLGLLSKYNYVIFIGGLAGASLLLREHRQIIWNRKVWIAAIIATLCFLPHGLWLLHHADIASAGTLQKMREGAQAANGLHNTFRGIASMFLGLFGFVLPLCLVYALACRPYFKNFRKQALDTQSGAARFFIYLYLVFFALMTLMLLSGQLSNIKGRWMQPLLFPLPLVFFLLLPGLAQPVFLQRILRTIAALAILILLAIPLRVQLGPAIGKYSRSHYPYHQLANEIARQFPQVGTLVASEKLEAGNLYFHRPQLHTILLGAEKPPEPLSGEILLIGPGGMQAEQLKRFHDIYPSSTIRQQGEFAIPYKKSRGEVMSFDYALLDAGQG